MTDISKPAPIASSRSSPRRLSIPRLGIGTSLAAMFTLLGDAIKMAYVEPYTVHRRRPRGVQDEDLDVRDPGW